MQGSQKTLESFCGEDRTESEDTHLEATSIDDTHMSEEVTYGNLIDDVIDRKNIETALKQVVGNRGAPGTDNMSVHELEEWLNSNLETFRQSIRDGQYIPRPVRRKEVPKPNGGVRNLGIPTVKDRLVQQMIAQVLIPIYDPSFSESSYGFRPGRSAQDAIIQSKMNHDEGYTTVVDIDLEKFFDTLNQRYLMNILRERIKDAVLIQLIKRFLRAGVTMPNGIVEATPVGSPQGGPLSPLLSNIYLDKLDKELERRGLRFCRYADDIQIFVRSRRAGERVYESITRFLENDLLLKVNRSKSKVGSPYRLKFLGFNLSYRKQNGAGIVPSKESVTRYKKRIRAITKRNRGVSLDSIIGELNRYNRGWTGYYGLSTSDKILSELDKWVRRRVRQYILKQWKRSYTRFTHLRNLCPDYLKGPESSVTPGWVRQCWYVAKKDSYWGASLNKTVRSALSNRWLTEQGLVCIMDVSKDVRERCSNRRVR